MEPPGARVNPAGLADARVGTANASGALALCQIPCERVARSTSRMPALERGSF